MSGNRTESILFLCSCGLTENLNFLLIAWCEGVCGILTCLHGLLQVTMETCVRMLWMPVTPAHVSTMELAMQLAPPPTPALVQAVRGWTSWTGPALYWRWQVKQDPLDWSIPFQCVKKRLLLLSFSSIFLWWRGWGWTKFTLPSPPTPKFVWFFQNFHIAEMRLFCQLADFCCFIRSRDYFFRSV